jgi:hypothetical protein
MAIAKTHIALTSIPRMRLSLVSRLRQRPVAFAYPFERKRHFENVIATAVTSGRLPPFPLSSVPSPSSLSTAFQLRTWYFGPRTSDLGPRTLDLGPRTSDFGPRTLDLGLWTSDFGPRTLDFGLWTLDFGLWTLDFGLWTLDFGLWTLDLGPCPLPRTAPAHRPGCHLKNIEDIHFQPPG